jgi:hypothetical protein
MKNILFLSLLSTFFFGCQIISKKNVSEKSEKAPYDYMYMQRAYPTGNIKTTASKEAIEFKKQLPSKMGAKAVIWEFAGPENVGGRITDIEIPIDEANVYYAGTASGGIFKTIDGGVSWSPIFDDAQSMAIGDIEISKSNTDVLWVGTGEPNAGGGSLAYDGDGIYNSTDAGITWTNKGLSDVGSISKVLIDPNDGNTVFASAMGALFKNDDKRGVYRTTDNGATWTQVLYVSDSTGVIDMVNHPTDSDIIYAATWERIRRPQYRNYGGLTSRIYRSNDGGDTWNELTNGLPSAAADKGRISIAISQSNPDVLYTRYADATGNIQGVYRTSDGGDIWTAVNSSQLDNVGFHWWFRGLYVDPTDENTLYNVDFNVQKSTDGGNNWTVAFPNVHVDQHALAFNNMTANEVLLGNDGGLFKSDDDAATSTKFTNLPITQFYRFYVDPQNGDKIYGGSQDNSTIRTTTGSVDDWQVIFGGDGFQPTVSADNTNIIYALSQRGNLGKSTNDGASFFNARNGISNADRNNWDTPVKMDPQNSDVLYYGTHRLYKTTNAAGTWSAISTDLTDGPGGGNLSFGTITTIDVSPLNGDFIVVGTDDANVWVTQNGGTDWNNVSATLPNLWTTKVLTDRVNPNTIYVTFSGYRYADNSGHIFKSENAGATWTDIGTGLPDIPINDVVKDKHSNIYIGTDVGVFASNNEGVDWISVGQNMPSVVITDLHIQEAEGFLYAATYGRSAYKANINTNPLSVESNDLSEGLKLFPNPTSDKITVSITEPFKNASIIFYDNMGKSVFESEISEKNTTLDISHVRKGIYYVRILKDEVASVKKLIVK